MFDLVLDKAKASFFDQQQILRRLSAAERRTLSRFGAFVRRRARSSLRYRKRGSSAAGNPPFVHTKDKVATLKNILFAYEAARHGVVIGPVRLNQKQYLNGSLRSGAVPAVHEKGGTLGIREKLVRGRWIGVGRRRPRQGEPVRVRLARYPARPFVGPAFRTETQLLPPQWRSAI